MRALCRLAVVLAVLGLSTETPLAQREMRRVFVRATDFLGSPILDLGAADFTLREGGMSREVTRGGLAGDVVRVALVVDSSDELAPALDSRTSVQDMRAALTAFVNALPPEYELGLFTTGRQMRVRVPPTTDRTRLASEAKEFSGDGAGNTLLDSIREIDQRFMTRPEDRWPVWVIVTFDGPELSRNMPDDVYARIVQGFIARGVTIHAVALQNHGGTLPTEVAQNLTNNTGGLYIPMIGSSGALAEHMRNVAERIAQDTGQMNGRYVLEYTSDQKAPLGDVDVGVVREGVRVQASIRRPF